MKSFDQDYSRDRDRYRHIGRKPARPMPFVTADRYAEANPMAASPPRMRPRRIVELSIAAIAASLIPIALIGSMIESGRQTITESSRGVHRQKTEEPPRQGTLVLSAGDGETKPTPKPEWRPSIGEECVAFQETGNQTVAFFMDPLAADRIVKSMAANDVQDTFNELIRSDRAFGVVGKKTRVRVLGFGFRGLMAEVRILDGERESKRAYVLAAQLQEK